MKTSRSLARVLLTSSEDDCLLFLVDTPSFLFLLSFEKASSLKGRFHFVMSKFWLTISKFDQVIIRQSYRFGSDQ